MSKLLEKIRSGGYWRVLIRPASFEEKRISDLSEFYPILQRTSVRLRGWDFPHIDQGPCTNFENHISQETEQDIFAELWQFYQSGQFIHYSSFLEDRLDQRETFQLPSGWQPGVSLDPMGVIFRFTEIFEFSARLTFTAAADDQTHLEISANGIKSRILKSDSGRLNVPGTYRSHVERLTFIRDYSNAHLVSNTKDLALEPAKELFESFGWNPDKRLLKDIQSELLRNTPVLQ